MTARPPGARAQVLPCARCGALNGADFDSCIRCGAPVSTPVPRPARATGWLDGRNLLATKVLGAMTALVFAGQVLAAHARGLGMQASWGEDYVRFGALIAVPGVPIEPLRLLSAVFVHFGPLHFGLNMLGLLNLARVAEPAVGSARFTVAYVVTGVFGFAATLLWGHYVQPEPVFTAGASGAVFGIMGVILGWLLRHRDPRWKPFALQAVLYSLVFGFIVNASSSSVRINNSAHIGGLISGALLGLVFAGRKRSRLEPLVILGALASLVASVVALVSAQSPPRSSDAASPDAVSQLAPAEPPGGDPHGAPG